MYLVLFLSMLSRYLEYDLSNASFDLSCIKLKLFIKTASGFELLSNE